jgi:hypothetical protein
MSEQNGLLSWESEQVALFTLHRMNFLNKVAMSCPCPNISVHGLMVSFMIHTIVPEKESVVSMDTGS